MGLGNSVLHQNSSQVTEQESHLADSNKLLRHLQVGISNVILIDIVGNVLVTGANRDGQLGLGDLIEQKGLCPVYGLPPINTASCETKHSLFLDFNGYIWACGNNRYGQLGVGDFVWRNIPVRIETLPCIRAVACNNTSSLFLDENGEVWGCGCNQFGQLGLGHGKNKISTPEKLLVQESIRAISLAATHCLLLSNSGSVWASGRNKDSPARIRESPVTYFPERLEIPPIVSICAPYLIDEKKTLWKVHTGYSNRLTKMRVEIANVGAKVDSICCGFAIYEGNLFKIHTNPFGNGDGQITLQKTNVTNIHSVHSDEGFKIFVDLDGNLLVDGILPFENFKIDNSRIIGYQVAFNIDAQPCNTKSANKI